MVWMMYAMFGFILLVFVFVIFTMIKRKGMPTTTATFDVFQISGNSFTVMAGIPVTYELDEIARITFSTMRGKYGNSYMGVMRVVKNNGKKSRPFLFDSSVYKKKLVLSNSKQDIEEAIRFLLDELKTQHIPCSRL